ncbi:conserved hypothetical protein [Hahella chejuensis KCTC 2396]|uniref:Uncharacterized protein n=1 Tax=Hahella chejuensis (strain KCTC 2396) TaxID=349521 RepID=Q2SEI7_HAHCH|nr:hypothetical protein [Hahella chejuensis]ABC30937.1 conserved hypothetical protein [Hahella chejuensis KCTC 2396]
MNPLALKLRELREPCVPLAPDFKNAKAMDISFSGSTLRVMLLDHKPSTAYEEHVKPKGGYDLFDSSQYKHADQEGFDYFQVLKRSCRFRGPLFTGYVAQLNTSLLIIKHKPTRPDFSLFNPHDFENTILSTLSAEYGNEILLGRSSYDAPIDWEVVKDFPVPCVTYEVRSGPHRDGWRNKYMAFPLRHEFYVRMSFHFEQSAVGKLNDQDRLINPMPLYELSQSIINSIKLELSPDAEKELEDVRSANPDAKLNEKVDPLKWTTPEDDAEWEHYCAEVEEKLKSMGRINKATQMEK